MNVIKTLFENLKQSIVNNSETVNKIIISARFG